MLNFTIALHASIESSAAVTKVKNVYCNARQMLDD